MQLAMSKKCDAKMQKKCKKKCKKMQKDATFLLCPNMHAVAPLNNATGALAMLTHTMLHPFAPKQACNSVAPPVFKPKSAIGRKGSKIIMHPAPLSAVQGCTALPSKERERASRQMFQCRPAFHFSSRASGKSDDM